MRIFLFRHGRAQPSQMVPQDRDRALSEEGVIRLRKGAGGMRRLGLRFDRIWTSPHLRARETAELLAEELDFVGEVEVEPGLAPGGDFPSLRTRLEGLRPESRVLMVGHAPDLGLFASELCWQRGTPEIPVKKGGLIRIDVEDIKEDPPGELRWILTGKHLRWMRKKKADRLREKKRPSEGFGLDDHDDDDDADF